jgi:hypothetical protein
MLEHIHGTDQHKSPPKASAHLGSIDYSQGIGGAATADNLCNLDLGASYDMLGIKVVTITSIR